jgi:LPXTG-site transpeptidase (sortase) family protein
MELRRSAVVLAWNIALVAALGVFAAPADEHALVPAKRAHSPLLAGAQPADVTSSAHATTAPATTTTPAAAPRVVAAPSPTADQTTVGATPRRSPDAIAPPDGPGQSASPPPTAGPPIVVDAQPVVEQSSEYVLDIPSIDLHEPVIAGDQNEIDQGHVTAVDWSSEGYPTSCLPGDGCTVWLAGHRSTHDAVFARLPEITAGAPIAIQFHGRTYTYTVTEVVTVPGTSPPSVITGDLVLQTSAPGDLRILIYAQAAPS